MPAGSRPALTARSTSIASGPTCAGEGLAVVGADAVVVRDRRAGADDRVVRRRLRARPLRERVVELLGDDGEVERGPGLVDVADVAQHQARRTQLGQRALDRLGDGGLERLDVRPEGHRLQRLDQRRRRRGAGRAGRARGTGRAATSRPARSRVTRPPCSQQPGRHAGLHRPDVVGRALVAGDGQAAAGVAAHGRARVGEVDCGLDLVREPQHGRHRAVLRERAQCGRALRRTTRTASPRRRARPAAAGSARSPR